MELIDTHCHLQFEEYKDREDEILADASHRGVKRIICVGTSLVDSKEAVGLASSKDNIWATTGVHPHEAGKFLADLNGSKKLKKIAGLPRVVAIGETGLDFYKQFSAKDAQERALRTHIEVSLELGLPLVFHIRDALPAGRQAWDDFWQIFDAYPNLRGVVHSFSADTKQLNETLSRGLFIGLNGIMTFTKDANQLAAAKAVPLDRLMLETDAPFLTPAPFRGEVCEPKHIATIAEFLADLRGEDPKVLAKVTTNNAVRLFGLEG